MDIKKKKGVKISKCVSILVPRGRFYLKPPQYLQRRTTKKQHRWTPFSIAGFKCEMQIKTSASELNRDMQSNKMRSLKTLGNVEAKPLSKILFWKLSLKSNKYILDANNL